MWFLNALGSSVFVESSEETNWPPISNVTVNCRARNVVFLAFLFRINTNPENKPFVK